MAADAVTRPVVGAAPRIAVVGAGWAGLAAAVQAVQQGAQVTLLEMAQQPGGRARQVQARAGAFDNGQHILIGAYSATLGLMRTVGLDPDSLLLRRPLTLLTTDGHGLALPAGAPVPAFVRAVLGASGWCWFDRLALLRTALRWRRQGFACPAGWTVQKLCTNLPLAVQRDLIDPLCVAALNTPAEQASAQVFLRVLQDALFAGPGSADLLLPRVDLSNLLPQPAWRWLQATGAICRSSHRVQQLRAHGNTWQVDGEVFDAVVLACSPTEAARLVAPHQPAWAASAVALQYQPIVTAYLADATLRLPQPMLALRAGPDAPAQFVFDLGAISGRAGVFAFVVSGATAWLADGSAGCGKAVLRQARAAFPGAFAGADLQVLQHVSAERRATFACTPTLQRPAMVIAAGLAAAGDHVAGPYPATLEGAVRSGLAAARSLA